jgi:hypothetical protein
MVSDPTWFGGGCGADNLSAKEILDFGYPQNTEIDALKMYITTESIKSEMAVVRALRYISDFVG